LFIFWTKKKWKDTEKLCAQNVLKKDQALGEGMKCDVTNTKEVKKCVEYILEKHGYIDVVVNAAVLHEGDAIDTEKVKIADVDKVLDINFKGALNVSQLVLPYMRAETYGRVVNLVSYWSLVPRKGQIVQASASGALLSASQVMAQEYVTDGVTVNCVTYAFVDMENGKNNEEYQKTAAKDVPMQRAAELAEIAGTVAWAACEENSYTTGFLYDCTGGLM